MITTLLFDFSRVLLHPKDKTYTEGLNKLYKTKRHELDFSFFNFFELNEELLTYLENIKHTVSLNIFTTEDIQNAPEVKKRIRKLFVNVFSAKQLGISKKEATSYLSIAASLHAAPEEILFIDDTQENLLYAAKAGLQTFHYQTNSELIKKLQSML